MTMPWTKDKYGQSVYKPSVYAKEELPTWSEVYEEFFQMKAFYYDPNNMDQQELDPYWNIPHTKFLLAVVCNQFNKMIVEDGYKEELIQDINRKICPMPEGILGVQDVRFTLEDFIYDKSPRLPIWVKTPRNDSYNGRMSELFHGPDSLPPIYTIPLPTGRKNPFIINDHPRIDISTLDTRLGILPVVQLQIAKFHTPMYDIVRPASFLFGGWYHPIILAMVKQYEKYFTGDIPGWKTKDGKLVESNQQHGCRTGFDPAL